MQTNTNAFAPYIAGAGLNIGVLPGTALIGTTPIAVGGTTVSLTANATNYVYLNTSSGALSASTFGFPSNQYSIATVVAGDNGVLSMIDSRCDVTPASGSPILTSVTNVSSAQLLALNVTPVELIAAPGAGKFINILSATWRYHAGLSAYVGTGLLLESALLGGFGGGIISSVDAFLLDADQLLMSPTRGDIGPADSYVNKPVTFNTNLSMTDGDGTVTIATIYTVETF